MVILCHKCSGLLCGHGEAPNNAYNCGCISGYVRDWQEPTNPRNVIAIQIAEMRDRLKLYESQKRPSTDFHLQFAKCWLEENDY